MGGTRHGILVALVLEICPDGLFIVGQAHRILVEIRDHILGGSQDKDHLVLGCEGIVAFIVTHGAVPDDHIVELHFLRQQGAEVQPDMLALAELAKDVEQSVRFQQPLAGPNPLEGPFQIGFR